MAIRVLAGDCREVLRTLQPASVQCVVTSPPYYGLRAYGVGSDNGELGSEPTPEQYIANLVDVFGAVRRVLRDDGTAWINLGDGFSNKQLQLMPSRVALALQADGWWLRSAITWCKRAPMPESVTDRPTSATEMVFLFAKSSRYYYDQEAVREPHQDARVVDGVYTGGGGVNAVGYVPHTQGFNGSGVVMKNREYNPAGRNSWNYWLLSPESYPGSHFAVFPTEIPRRAILAGTSERGGCPACGAAWRRTTETSYRKNCPSAGNDPRSRHEDRLDAARGAGGWKGNNLLKEVQTLSWAPTCRCEPVGEPVPQTVLDPFGGSGTTGLVADRLGRDAILIELNPEYARMAEDRVRGDAPLFNGAGSLPAAPVVDKQGQLGKRTYSGFNARWDAKELFDETTA